MKTQIYTENSKVYLAVSKLRTNGEKFYIVLNGKPTAIKLVDTYVNASGEVRGHFKCANGQEFLDGKLGIEQDFTRTCPEHVAFTDMAACRKDDYSICKMAAYASLDDLRAQRTIPYEGLYHIAVNGPIDKIYPTNGNAKDLCGRKFHCSFYKAYPNNGSVKRLEDEFDKIVNIGGEWYLADTETNAPYHNFKENVFGREKDAREYLAKKASESEVVDFSEVADFDDEHKREEPKTITISIHVGDVEQKEVIPADLLNVLLNNIHGLK